MVNAKQNSDPPPGPPSLAQSSIDNYRIAF